MRRRGKEWKTNFSRGAEVEPVQLSAELEKLALEATRLIGLDYAGVDLMTAEDGTAYVIEINSIPGWRGLQQTTSRKIADCIIDHILQ